MGELDSLLLSKQGICMGVLDCGVKVWWFYLIEVGVEERGGYYLLISRLIGSHYWAPQARETKARGSVAVGPYITAHPYVTMWGSLFKRT